MKQEQVVIQAPEGLPENLIEKTAADLARRHRRTIIVQISHGPNQRDLIVPPNHKRVRVPSDMEEFAALHKKLQDNRQAVSDWGHSLEEKIRSGE